MVLASVQFKLMIALLTANPDVLLTSVVTEVNVASGVPLALKTTDGVPLLTTPTQPAACDTVYVRLVTLELRVVTLGAVTVKPPEGAAKVTGMVPEVIGIAGVTVIVKEAGPLTVLQVGVMEGGLRTSLVLLVTASFTVSDASVMPLAAKLNDGVAPLVMLAQLDAVFTV